MCCVHNKICETRARVVGRDSTDHIESSVFCVSLESGMKNLKVDAKGGLEDPLLILSFGSHSKLWSLPLIVQSLV